MVPNIQRQEWSDLLTEKLSVKLNSLSLQLKLNALKVSLKTKKNSLDTAVLELQQYCNNNEKMYENDLKKIFKTI